MNNNDWRLTNQMNYLFRKKLIKGAFRPYREGWEHEHCEFCTERIDNTTDEVYSTLDSMSICLIYVHANVNESDLKTTQAITIANKQ